MQRIGHRRLWITRRKRGESDDGANASGTVLIEPGTRAGDSTQRPAPLGRPPAGDEQRHTTEPISQPDHGQSTGPLDAQPAPAAGARPAGDGTHAPTLPGSYGDHGQTAAAARDRNYPPSRGPDATTERARARLADLLDELDDDAIGGEHDAA